MDHNANDTMEAVDYAHLAAAMAVDDDDIPDATALVPFVVAPLSAEPVDDQATSDPDPPRRPAAQPAQPRLRCNDDATVALIQVARDGVSGRLDHKFLGGLPDARAKAKHCMLRDVAFFAGGIVTETKSVVKHANPGHRGSGGILKTAASSINSKGGDWAMLFRRAAEALGKPEAELRLLWQRCAQCKSGSELDFSKEEMEDVVQFECREVVRVCASLFHMLATKGQWEIAAEELDAMDAASKLSDDVLNRFASLRASEQPLSVEDQVFFDQTRDVIMTTGVEDVRLRHLRELLAGVITQLCQQTAFKGIAVAYGKWQEDKAAGKLADDAEFFWPFDVRRSWEELKEELLLVEDRLERATKRAEAAAAEAAALNVPSGPRTLKRSLEDALGDLSEDTEEGKVNLAAVLAFFKERRIC